MFRRIQKTAAALAVAVLFLGAGVSAPAPAFASAELMQCMVDCIMTEGKDEKDTCKSRCADISISADPENRDCMAIYKQCKKVCESDKECKQICKDALLNCV